MKEKRSVSLNMALSRGTPLPTHTSTHTHTHTHWTDLTPAMGTCGIRVWTDGVSAHRLRLLICNSYPEGVMTFLIWNLTFKYFSIIAQALVFLLNIFTFSQRLKSWHPHLSYKLLAMNEIYILKKILSTTATSQHQICYKENNNIKLLLSHLAFGTVNLTSYWLQF